MRTSDPSPKNKYTPPRSRNITCIVLHCTSAAPHFGVNDIDEWHRFRGFLRTNIPSYAKNKKNLSIGYHYVVNEDGTYSIGRDEIEVGAHVKGFNKNSIGIVLCGTNKFNDKQIKTVISLIKELMIKYKLEPKDVLGHYELDKGGKTCPNIDMHAFRQQLV